MYINVAEEVSGIPSSWPGYDLDSVVRPGGIDFAACYIFDIVAVADIIIRGGVITYRPIVHYPRQHPGNYVLYPKPGIHGVVPQ